MTKITVGTSKYISISAQQRISTRADSYFNVINTPKSDSFVGVENYFQDYSNEASSNNTLIHLSISLDPTQQLYSRTIYSFLAFSGDLGGVFQILEVVGGIIVSFLANKLFVYSILSKIYQVDGNDLTNKENKTTIYPFQTKKVSEDLSKQNNMKIIENSDGNTHNILKRAIEVVKNRKLYSYSFCDLIYNLFWPIKWITFRLKCWNKYKNRHLLLQKGSEKYTQEMDLVSFIKSVRRVEMLINSQLSERQKFFEQFQHSHVISLNSSSEDLSKSKSFISQLDSKNSPRKF